MSCRILSIRILPNQIASCRFLLGDTPGTLRCGGKLCIFPFWVIIRSKRSESCLREAKTDGARTTDGLSHLSAPPPPLCVKYISISLWERTPDILGQSQGVFHLVHHRGRPIGGASHDVLAGSAVRHRTRSQRVRCLFFRGFFILRASWEFHASGGRRTQVVERVGWVKTVLVTCWFSEVDWTGRPLQLWFQGVGLKCQPVGQKLLRGDAQKVKVCSDFFFKKL